jgi:2-methylcitrate dehydratase PrpD
MRPDLAHFAVGLRFEDIPHAVVDHAKLCFLDGLGVALFGAGLPWTGHVREMVLAEGATPAASFSGTAHHGSIAQAALVNGTTSHAFEMDDIPRSRSFTPTRRPVRWRWQLPRRHRIQTIQRSMDAGHARIKLEPDL